jgi:hypothetical protein
MTMAAHDEPTQTDVHRGDDFAAHENTYEGFVRLAAIATVWVLTHVVALAIGGTSGRWSLAGFWIFVSTIAAVVGLAVRGLDWKPVTIVLAMMLATLLVVSY